MIHTKAHIVISIVVFLFYESLAVLVGFDIGHRIGFAVIGYLHNGQYPSTIAVWLRSVCKIEDWPGVALANENQCDSAMINQ